MELLESTNPSTSCVREGGREREREGGREREREILCECDVLSSALPFVLHSLVYMPYNTVAKRSTPTRKKEDSPIEREGEREREVVEMDI